MTKLYGGAQGRASRCLLALEELGVTYEHVPLKPWDSADDRARLAALNPNARVPVLDDDGLVLWESMAINLYLGDRYGAPPLWPSARAQRALLYQWSVWSQTSIDVIARHRGRFSKDETVKETAEAERLAALAILDRALADRSYLLGHDFTLADVNVAATLSEPWENGRVDGDFDPIAHGLASLGDWLARCTQRDSWVRVGAMA